MSLFATLEKMTERPEPFEYYTTPQLWNDPHISKGMLDAHLNPDHDARLLCTKYAIVEKNREFEIYNWNQCYSAESLKETFAENGLQILQCLSDVSGTPIREDSRTIAIVAQRST